MELTNQYDKNFECACGHCWEAESVTVINRNDPDGFTSVLKSTCRECGSRVEREAVIVSVGSNKPKYPPLAKEKYPGTDQTMIRRDRHQTFGKNR